MSDGATNDRRRAEWSELAALIDALLEVEPEKRAARIIELSDGDPARRSQLQGLLEECQRDDHFLGTSAAERFSALLVDDIADFPVALTTRYEPTEKLGEGGMATVYLARDLKHGREVAVKLVHSVVADALGADRFLREIEIAAQLHHPLIVPLYDSGEADGRLYYVMPYLSGSSLRERLERQGPLPIEEVVSILRDVCDALAYAHGRGIVHRDIKPGNVLQAGRHALVADFGVAKAVTDATPSRALTAAGIVVGTPAYMAPEQVVADPNVDLRADIYAVGVLAYELLAGVPPFVGQTRQEVLAAQLADAPVPIAQRRPETPRQLSDLVMRCLEKHPASRWQSADAMIPELDATAVRHDQIGDVDGSKRKAVRIAAGIAALFIFAILAAFAWRRNAPGDSWHTRWSAAHIERLTDFPGDEVDAALSSDGKFVAFLADRDSGFDAFVTQIGSGQFINLTNGRFPQLFNDDVRNIGFSGDGSNVWLRAGEIAAPAGVRLVPTFGGAFRPFVAAAVMTAWSPDGSRIAYHEATLGDAIHVANSDGSNDKRIHVAAPGIHSHHLSWSLDGRDLYFAHGFPPEEMDIWRVSANGGTPERLTTHVSRVAYPVMVDDRTLLYTATADDGTGPWLYAMDVRSKLARRLSTGVEHYLSIAAAPSTVSERRRLVATVSNPNVQLWRIPITNDIAGEDRAERIALPTARAAAPRFDLDSSLLYLASRGGADGLWRLTGGVARELWKPTVGTVAGAAAASPKDGRVCFAVRRNGRSTLHCGDRDASVVTPFAPSLDVRGSPSWSPDGEWLAVTVADSNGLRLVKLSTRGNGAPVRLADSVASNPVWSPDGSLIVYSGTPRGRSVPLLAMKPDGEAVPLPSLSVDRVGDSYRFLPQRNQLVVKLGGFRRQDFWLFDLSTGRSRRLTQLRPGESIRRFDVSPSGKEILFERVRQNSDVVLIEVPNR